MIKEQLAEEIENKGVEYVNSINYTIPKFSDENGYCWGQVEEAYEKGALDFAEPREKRIEELETRCTELFLQNNEFAERFEKSIEIIKELARVAYADYTDGDYSNELSKVLEQAEQFLKEE